MAILGDFLTVKETADALQVSERTLARWWTERIGPPRTKLGHRVYYRKEAVRDWALRNEAAPVRDARREVL